MKSFKSSRFKFFVAATMSLFFVLAIESNLEAKVMKTKAPLKVAEEMVDAWNKLDLDRIVDTFAEDGVLHSVMIEPVKGREALRTRLGAFLTGATRLNLQLKNVAVVGNTVFLERVDDFDYKGKHGAVPVVGVMEISDGKVKIWREYYDRDQLLHEMGISEGPKQTAP
jgi:limonene-1,2-epoxide hydrolase